MERSSTKLKNPLQSNLIDKVIGSRKQDGLTCQMEILQDPLNLRVDLHVRPLEPEVGQVLCGPESSGKDEPGKVSRDELFKRQDGSPGDSGRLVEDVAFLFHDFATLVIDDVCLNERKIRVEGSILVSRIKNPINTLTHSSYDLGIA